MKLDKLYLVVGAALSDQRRLALVVKRYSDEERDGTDFPLEGFLVDISQPDKPTVEKTPQLPCASVEHFEYSPKAELVLTDCGRQSVKVYALRAGSFQKIAEASQPPSEGRVFDPKLFFGSDGKPIVTWEDFFPH
jgi:hypothetical protein